MLLVVSNFYKQQRWLFSQPSFYQLLKQSLIIFFGFIVFSLPFSLNFKPFVSGIGVLCAPSFLTNIGRLGPFLFEANHCQRTPFWQFVMLYGFFYFFVISFLFFLKFKKKYTFTKNDIFVLMLISLSTILILIPEFIYVKDIYPDYYRANTMFKLVYEAFILLSLSSGYILVKLISGIQRKRILIPFSLVSLMLLSLILVYPVFAINSYYNNLQTKNKSLDGITYLSTLYPNDYKLINWLNANIQGQPVILEASGDSYTDYARISANTGLPTVIGWSVHEWLWRGTYDIVAPRIADVQTLYTTQNLSVAKSLLKKYHVSYVVVSELEREKYPNLNEQTFAKLGKLIFESGQTRLYKITI
jgi:YYY domain-containing protein